MRLHDSWASRVGDLLGLSKDLVLYTARHSFATGQLDMTGDIKLVADTLGHADTKIAGTYLRPSSESAAHFTAHSPSEDFRRVP